MNKSVWESVGIPEVTKQEAKSRTVLFFLVDVMTATKEPSHIQYHNHEDYTRDSLWSILMRMSENKRLMLIRKFKKDKTAGDEADDALDVFLRKKLRKLEKMVYRTIPLTKQELSGSHFNVEEMQLACLLASVLDFEEELEVYVRKMMAPKTFRRLPRP